MDTVAPNAPRARSRAGGGRPARKRTGLERLTPTVRAAIVQMVREGVPMTTAAVSAGVPRRTFQEWLAKGRGPEGREPFKAFVAEIEQAFADWQVGRLKIVEAAGERDYRAATWQLERRVPQDFGDPRRGDVNVNVNLIESPDWRELSDRLLRVLAPFPEALAAVVAELGGGEVVEGEAAEVMEIES